MAVVCSDRSLVSLNRSQEHNYKSMENLYVKVFELTVRSMCMFESWIPVLASVSYDNELRY